MLQVIDAIDTTIMYSQFLWLKCIQNIWRKNWIPRLALCLWIGTRKTTYLSEGPPASTAKPARATSPCRTHYHPPNMCTA